MNYAHCAERLLNLCQESEHAIYEICYKLLFANVR
jgi:hypothetical protein